MVVISIDDILKAKNTYKINRFANYNERGGIYLIYDKKNNKGYIGQSQNYLYRLRTHILNIKRGKYSEIEFNECIDDLSFYLVIKFNDVLNIDRYNEDIIRFIEMTFIKRYNTLTPFGYNKILEKNKFIYDINHFENILNKIIITNTKRQKGLMEFWQLIQSKNYIK